MPIFRNIKNKLSRVKEKDVPLEKYIQNTTESNLDEVFGLKLVKTEFVLNRLRFDSLCFDEENKAFVIIEYKKEKSFSVIDQGFSYLALMLSNKAEFIVEYNERFKDKQLRREDINWDSSRVIFVSPFFTTYQKGAINVKGLPIELWEVRFYETDLIEYERINPIETSTTLESITGKSKIIKEVSNQIKTYDLETHLAHGSDKTREIFNILREKVLDLGKVTETYRKLYVGYHIGESKMNFVTVHFFREKLDVYILIPVDKLNDPKKLAKRIPESYGWAKNLALFTVRSEKDIREAIDLVEQSYEFNKNR